MRKGIKYALLFTGGVAVGIGVCGASLISYAFSDEYIREGIKNKISRKVNKALYGERPRRGTGPISYRSYYKEGIKKNREKYTSEDVVFESRAAAKKALSIMNDICNKYGFVTVADMYDMADLPAPYTSNKYGWTNIKNTEVLRVRSGYIIKLPLEKSLN